MRRDFIFCIRVYTNDMKHKGFTVLEFLIVVAIMAILVGLILVGLNAARENARDQEKISNLRRIALGIQQYHDMCREYPADLIPSQPLCNTLNTETLEKLIPDIGVFRFEDDTSDYGYAPIADGYPEDPDTCTGYHLWVKLEKDRDTNAARFDSTITNQCSSSYPRTMNASTLANEFIYDIHK